MGAAAPRVRSVRSFQCVWVCVLVVGLRMYTVLLSLLFVLACWHSRAVYFIRQQQQQKNKKQCWVSLQPLHMDRQLRSPFGTAAAFISVPDRHACIDLFAPRQERAVGEAAADTCVERVSVKEACFRRGTRREAGGVKLHAVTNAQAEMQRCRKVNGEAGPFDMNTSGEYHNNITNGLHHKRGGEGEGSTKDTASASTHRRTVSKSAIAGERSRGQMQNKKEKRYTT